MAVEGGVAAFDAIFDKGKLGSGKFLTVAGLVFGQVQPLPQPQLQNQIVLRAASAIQDGCGVVVEEGFCVGRVVEPLAAHAGVGRRAEAR